MKQANIELNEGCEFTETLMGYLYNELSPREAQSFEQHLKGCQPCQRDLSDFRLVRQALGEWQVDDTPHFVFQVKPSFWQMARQMLALSPVWGKLAVGALAVVLLLALFNVKIEFNPSTGFRFQASLLPTHRVEPVAQPAVQRVPQSSVDLQALAAMVDEKIRQSETRQQAIWTKQMQSEREAMLTKLSSQQEQQWTQLMREVESRRSGALTFADIFFPEKGNN